MLSSVFTATVICSSFPPLAYSIFQVKLKNGVYVFCLDTRPINLSSLKNLFHFKSLKITKKISATKNKTKSMSDVFKGNLLKPNILWIQLLTHLVPYTNTHTHTQTNTKQPTQTHIDKVIVSIEYFFPFYSY